MFEIPFTLQREKAIDAFHNRAAISYSRIHAYDTCPEQYRLRYIEGYRPRQEKAHLVFGTAMHLALAEHFRSEKDPVATFADEWERIKSQPLRYDGKESWWDFRQKGTALLEKFLAEERSKITNVRAVEDHFELNIANVPLPVIGLIDLVADVEGERTIVDFKTSGLHYHLWEAQLKEVRLIEMVSHRSDKYGIDWITIYSLVTAEIARGTIAELRIVHGTTAQPIALADEDKKYRDLVAKANERHQTIEERLRAAGLIVRKGACRPDGEALDGDLE